jgi:heme/copper-type cytochrome/quinol oxidase subunit 3
MPTADLPAYDENTPREPSFRNAGTVGMILFLAALFMLFAASLLAYVMIRVGSPTAPPAGSIHLPALLWLSTVLVVGVSVALAMATRQIREGKHRSYRKSLTAALAMAAGFLSVQTPALISLLAQHHALASHNMRLYGLIFFLILLHALHVVGGMVSLIIVTIKAHRGAYERPVAVPAGSQVTDPGHDPIRHTTLYWHFLDCVWIVMFSVLLILR